MAAIDERVAVRYATVRAELKRIGRPLPENDIWIAAVCLEERLPLLTADHHFESVPGIDLRRT